MKKTLSLISQGLRYKLKIAFYLMSILPLLVLIYIVTNYILPQMGLKLDIVAVIIISLFISLNGFLLVKEIFDRIQSISNKAKLMAEADITRKIEISPQDEIDILGDTLNQLTQRIRSNMEELKSYGDKTAEINVAIQKRVLVLSGLLQISSLISQGAHLDDILNLVTEKAKLLANSELAYLLFREEDSKNFYVKIADGINAASFLNIRIEPKDELLQRILKTYRPLVLDKENVSKDLVGTLSDKFGIKNAILLPVYVRKEIFAILGVGNNRQDFVYQKDDLELLDVFAKQVAIAIENDFLVHRLEQLEIKDALTGLYNKTFICNRLDEEIQRAIIYQRPCAFILFNIDDFQEFQQNFGFLQAEAVLKKVAFLIKNSVSEIDRVGRTGDNEFAVVLPEKNKRNAYRIAEEIRKKIEEVFQSEPQINKRITISGGVSENPLDGTTAEELISKATDLLKTAKIKGKNQILV